MSVGEDRVPSCATWTIDGGGGRSWDCTGAPRDPGHDSWCCVEARTRCVFVQNQQAWQIEFPEMTTNTAQKLQVHVTEARPVQLISRFSEGLIAAAFGGEVSFENTPCKRCFKNTFALVWSLLNSNSSDGR